MARWETVAGTCLLLAVGACSKSGTNTAAEQPPGPEASVSAPVVLTDAEKKALLAELPPAFQAADLSNGEAKFAVCRSCHTTIEGAPNGIGPNLWGVFGRRAGSESGFSYSDDLKNAGWTWDAAHLDKWIENPRAVLSGTKMTFAGIADPKDRTDLIAYLRVETNPPPKS